MSISPPTGRDGDESLDPPDDDARRPAELQLRRQERRRARRGPDAPVDAYDVSTAKGIEGEQIVGGELERRLEGSGCRVDHSVRFLGFGDIDHLVVGPGGVTIVDAKNWSGMVTVDRSCPRVGRRRRPKEVEKLHRQVAGLRLALRHAPAHLRNVSVRGVLCLAAEPDRRERELRHGLVLGGSAVAAEIAGRRGDLLPLDVAILRHVLLEQLPRVTRSEIDAFLAPAVPATEAPTTYAAQPADARRSSRARKKPRSLLNRLLRRVISGTVILLITAVAMPLVVWWTIAHLQYPGASDTLSHLRVSRHARHLVVNVRASESGLVRLRVSGSGVHRRVTLTGEPGRNTWRGPVIGSRHGAIRVRACVVLTTGHCTSPITRRLRSHR
jgi:hypothetical protein